MGAAVETAATISFSCGACGRRIRCPASFAGKAARCPGCKTAVRAPEAREAKAKTRTKPEPERASRPERVREAPERVRQAPEVDTAKLLGGLGAMAGAVVWFLVGLQNDVIFFYPPVLFVIGLGGVIRACAGRGQQDD